MKIIDKKLAELTPYANNPRLNDGAVDAVAASIKAFGFKVPIVIDANGVIVAGHTRLKAAQKLGLKTVPCVVADDLTPEQIKAFRLADNKVGELAEWDFEKLNFELDSIDMDMSMFGFDSMDAPDEEDKTYTDKISGAIYEPTGRSIDITDCYDDTRYNSLIEHIESANIDENVKRFLRFAAVRHIILDYQKIAEFYANADKDIQELFEESALVIIDYDQAVENGFVRLKEEIAGIMDDGEEE